jgi:hypothetical protein
MRCADERATELRKSGEVVANSGRHVVGQNRSSVPDSIQSADDVGPQNVASDLSNGITSKFETLRAGSLTPSAGLSYQYDEPTTNSMLFGTAFFCWAMCFQGSGRTKSVENTPGRCSRISSVCSQIDHPHITSCPTGECRAGLQQTCGTPHVHRPPPTHTLSCLQVTNYPIFTAMQDMTFPAERYMRA